jgi:hypothetical protein
VTIMTRLSRVKLSVHLHFFHLILNQNLAKTERNCFMGKKRHCF